MPFPPSHRDGHRLTAFATNTAPGGPGRQLADLELRHRRRARAEDRIRAPLTETVLVALAHHRLPANSTIEQAVRHDEIRRLSVALRQAAQALKSNRRQLHELVEGIALGLLDRPGLGPVSAAQAVVSYSHPGRVRNEAAFAGWPELPAPSQPRTTVRHRLNRGGDRTLNRAVPYDRASPHEDLRADPQLRRPAHRRRQDRPQDPPRPQALHHPRAYRSTDRHETT